MKSIGPRSPSLIFSVLRRARICTNACEAHVSDMIDGRIELRTSHPLRCSSYVCCRLFRGMQRFHRRIEDNLADVGRRDVGGGSIRDESRTKNVRDKFRLYLVLKIEKATRWRRKLEMRDGHMRPRTTRHEKKSTRSPRLIRATLQM